MIEQTIRGESVRREIADSWQRVRMTGLSPSRGVIEEAADFDPRSRLMRAAGTVMESLKDELAGTGIGVLLADRSAVIVDRIFGTDAMRRDADSVGAHLGAQFTEELSGTNAIATPHETRAIVSIRGPEHYLDVMKDFRCIGMPIIHPMTNRLEGVLDLMVDEPVEEPLMRFIAGRTVQDMQQRLVDDMDAKTAAAVRAFHSLAGRTEDPLLLFGEDYVLTSRTSVDLLETSDHRDLATIAEEMHAGDDVVRVTLSSGRTVGIRVSALSSERAKLLRVSLRRSAPRVIPRSRVLKRAADAVLETEIQRARASSGHVLVTGERGSGRTAAARRVAEGSRLSIVRVGDVRSAEDLQDEIRTALSGEGAPETLLIEDVELLDEVQRTQLASFLSSDSRTRFILTQAVSAGGEPRSYLSSLCVHHLRLKPLRARLIDFEDIVSEIIRELAPGSAVRVKPDVIDILKTHPWNGNFNELRTVLSGVLARMYELELDEGCSGDRCSVDRRDWTRLDGHEIKPEHLPSRYQRSAAEPTRRLSPLEMAERAVIEAALSRNRGNKVHTAEELEISRSTLYSRVKYLGIT